MISWGQVDHGQTVTGAGRRGEGWGRGEGGGGVWGEL